MTKRILHPNVLDHFLHTNKFFNTTAKRLLSCTDFSKEQLPYTIENFDESKPVFLFANSPMIK